MYKITYKCLRCGGTFKLPFPDAEEEKLSSMSRHWNKHHSNEAAWQISDWMEI